VRITRLGSYYCFVLILAVKVRAFQASRYSGRLLNVLRRCPFYSNFRTKLVAVQRDPIHNLNFYEGVRLIVFCCRGPKGPYPQKSLKCNFLTMKQLSLDTVHEMNLIKNELVLHLSLTNNVNLRLNFSLFS
jgi:hypothetical protein